MASSTEKRCLYEVLGLSRDCSADEIRSAYRKLALQRHPDKLVRAGISEAEATSAFQELVNAYEVLSDAKERAWYDSHRNQILFSSSTAAAANGSSSSFVPDLFSFFSNTVYSGYSDSGRGFYRVYGDLFEKIYANELSFAKKLGLPLPKEAPLMGNLESPYVQVTAFYNYWLGFVTTMEFFWADEYDATAGPNRKSRRLMEEENKKLRKKARREYNETVRGLAEFVKKRDKRVIDMQVKRNEEMQKKKEEEKQRKKELERQKAERARQYEEPEWAKVDELEDDEAEDVEEEEEEKKNELYCVACSKKFKSDKQWKNHEQSKKHKEKVAELREAFGEEDREYEATERNGKKGNAEKEADGDGSNYFSADDGANGLRDQFVGSVSIKEEEIEDANDISSEEDEVADVVNSSVEKGVGVDLGSDDDEAGILEAMVSGRKSRNKAGYQTKAPAKKTQVEIDSDELDFMDYNDTKVSRRNKGGRKARGRKPAETAETLKTDAAGSYSQAEEHNEQNGDSHVGESTSPPSPEHENMSSTDDVTEKNSKHPQKAVNKNHMPKKETVSKSKVASKGRLAEAAETMKTDDAAASSSQAEEHNEQNGVSHVGESTSSPSPEHESKSRADDVTEKNPKHPQKAGNKNHIPKKETVSKSKVASKGRRKKAAAEDYDNVCEKCGLEFESRNRLHKHLGDTGHASLKSR